MPGELGAVIAHRVRDEFDPDGAGQFAESDQNDARVVGRQALDAFPKVLILGEQRSDFGDGLHQNLIVGVAPRDFADRKYGVAVGAESLHNRPRDAPIGDEIHTDAIANEYTTSVRIASAANRIAARTSASVMCG